MINNVFSDCMSMEVKVFRELFDGKDASSFVCFSVFHSIHCTIDSVHSQLKRAL